MTQSSRLQVSYNGFHRVTFEENAADCDLFRLQISYCRIRHKRDMASCTLATT